MLSPEQIELRKLGITATDAAAICGAHPWRSPLDVWLEKRGETVKEYEENAPTIWGHRLEPLIRNDYAERHGARVEVPGTLMHAEDEWKLATPDGIVYLGHGLEPDRGLEIKVHNERAMRALRYGSPGSDDVPPHELIQGVWGMAVTGLPRWDLCVFNGSPTDYVIDRDEELVGMVAERCERFLVDHVRANVPPPPDGSATWDAWIAQRFNAHNAEAAIVPLDKSDPLLLKIASLRETRATLAQLDKTETLLEQAIKERIGNNAGLEFPSRTGRGKERITYKRPKDSIETDWEACVVELRNIAQVAAQSQAQTAERAIIALDKLAEEHFANTRAAIRGCEIRECIIALRDALVTVAKASTIAVNTKTVPNSRRLLVPANWKKED